MIRQLIKGSAEAILGGHWLTRVFKKRTSGLDLILGYHNVVPPGESPIGTESLHIGSDAFLEHVEEAMGAHRAVLKEHRFEGEVLPSVLYRWSDLNALASTKYQDG